MEYTVCKTILNCFRNMYFASNFFLKNHRQSSGLTLKHCDTYDIVFEKTLKLVCKKIKNCFIDFCLILYPTHFIFFFSFLSGSTTVSGFTNFRRWIEKRVWVAVVNCTFHATHLVAINELLATRTIRIPTDFM